MDRRSRLNDDRQAIYHQALVQIRMGIRPNFEELSKTLKISQVGELNKQYEALFLAERKAARARWEQEGKLRGLIERAEFSPRNSGRNEEIELARALQLQDAERRYISGQACDFLGFVSLIRRFPEILNIHGLAISPSGKLRQFDFASQQSPFHVGICSSRLFQASESFTLIGLPLGLSLIVKAREEVQGNGALFGRVLLLVPQPEQMLRVLQQEWPELSDEKFRIVLGRHCFVRNAGHI